MTIPVKVQNGGLFISRGTGRHPQRILDSWELIFVEKGTLTLKEENETFVVNKGESLLLWPQRRHAGTGNFPADLKFYWLHFEIDPAVQLTEEAAVTLLSVPQHGKVNNSEEIISLFRLFLTEQESLTRTLTLEFILLLILQKLAITTASDNDMAVSGIALAYKAQQLIRTQYHQVISTSILAEQLYCNADYLGRVYRKTFHLTITDAIHRQRVISAEKLLITDACPLSEVAKRCGFHDVGYFRQIFRKETGLTPAAYKRRYCKEHINSD